MEEARRYYEGIGRRKRASARVRIYPGDEGNWRIYGKWQGCQGIFSRVLAITSF